MNSARNPVFRLVWLGAGFLSLFTGLVGIVLPLLPTVPFLLLAAFCFERGSERVHNWLINHNRLGRPIRDWRRYGAISRRAKTMAVVTMIIVVGLSILFSVPWYIVAIQVAVLSLVALFILTRPPPPMN